jgi:hypothetical protein
MITSALTDAELASRLAAAEAKALQLRSQLEQLQSVATGPIAPHARDELNKRIVKFKVC